VALLLVAAPVTADAGLNGLQRADLQAMDAQEALTPNAQPVSDDFNACALNTQLWQFVDPVGDSSQAVVGGYTGSAKLDLTVPSGSSHDIWNGVNLAARAMQNITNPSSFEVVARFLSGVSDKYQMQGILIQQDDSKFLRVELYGNGNGTVLFVVFFDNWIPVIHYEKRVANIGTLLHLKVKRATNKWTVSWSANGVQWTPIDTLNATLTANKIGVYAANAGTVPPTHTAMVDYFFDVASPISPEDGGVADLIVTPVGSGTVTVSPEKASYSCFESVTLDAEPAANWRFANWSGALTGTTDPATLIMAGPARVTATFEPIQYALNIDIVPPSAGAVTRDPDQLTYGHGTPVTLVPVPGTDWRFVNWTGQDAGALVDNHDGSWTIAMTEVRDLTANFEPASHNLALGVAPAGSGSVAKNPDLPAYPHNSDVILTPVGNPGWAFYGWSGQSLADLVDNGDGTWTLKMDADKSLTANFIQAVYYIDLTVVGRGTVQIVPIPEGPYLYGEVATLTPLAATSWKFAGWSGPNGGDLIDQHNGTWTLTMNADKEVTASFVSYPVYLSLIYH